MREILGRRRRLLSRLGLSPSKAGGGRPAHLDAALTCATAWKWPVLPGVGLARDSGGRSGRGRACACPDPECTVPGEHPFDPGLPAATTDERMVRWWWTNRPTAPVVLATGGAAPCAVSVPAIAGARALAALDRAGMRLGPVVATPARWSLLVAPYSLERLGELLYAKDRVPGSLRFHGAGGYLVLPPSEVGAGQVRWERGPSPSSRLRSSGGDLVPGSAAPWLPDVEAVLDALVESLVRV
ncbi:bifunctional DNA primase/polymerase [Streptomyces sannanensis]|uniref:Bifunctional DNA primase/polymerase n=1 Tax=Streptomyces sannanensis TaxID=285536 RepID=A0ABP6SCQ6_9ACTN